MLSRKPIADATEPNSAHRDPMRGWYEVSWVRSAKLDYIIPETVAQPVLFSPHLVPPLAHPDIVERGPRFAAELLCHRFYTYADFTSVLEREAINEVTKDLSRRVFWAELPAYMYRGAGRIYTDEAFHAQESDAVLEGIVSSTGIEPEFLHRPRFLTNLDLLCSNLDSGRRRLAMHGFAIVSETLISAILADIPNDPSVVPAVRDFVREHARDEGRHHVYFSELLRYGWPSLSRADRGFLGPLFPRFVRWFLDPDLEWLRSFLSKRGFRHDQIEEIIGESYPSKKVSENIRSAARHSLARFAEVGILEENIAADVFRKEGLL